MSTGITTWLQIEGTDPAAAISGAITADNAIAAGALALQVVVGVTTWLQIEGGHPDAAFITGSVAADGAVAAGALGLAPVILATLPFRNWAGTLLANTIIEKVAVLRQSDLVVILSAANLTTDALGVLTLSSVLFFPGQVYLVVTSNANSTAFGCQPYTAV